MRELIAKSSRREVWLNDGGPVDDRWLNLRLRDIQQNRDMNLTFGGKGSGTREAAVKIIEALSNVYDLGYARPEPTTLEQFQALPIGAKFRSNFNSLTTYTKVDDDRFASSYGTVFSASHQHPDWATSSSTKLTLVERTTQDFKDEFAALSVGDQFTITGGNAPDGKAVKVDDNSYFVYDTKVLINIEHVDTLARIVKN